MKNCLKVQLKDIAASLFELWNLMDSPTEEKNKFSRITSVLGFAESEIIEPGVLSSEIIEQVWTSLNLLFILNRKVDPWIYLFFWQASAEVERLAKLKASRMKELVMKRRSELEDVCKMTHIEPDTSTNPEKSTALIDSGTYILVFSSYFYWWTRYLTHGKECWLLNLAVVVQV